MIVTCSYMYIYIYIDIYIDYIYISYIRMQQVEWNQLSHLGRSSSSRCLRWPLWSKLQSLRCQLWRWPFCCELRRPGVVSVVTATTCHYMSLHVTVVSSMIWFSTSRFQTPFSFPGGLFGQNTAGGGLFGQNTGGGLSLVSRIAVGACLVPTPAEECSARILEGCLAA